MKQTFFFSDAAHTQIPDTASQPEDFLGRTDLNFCFHPVNVGYILNHISNLKPSVSCGLDNISSRLLKLCSPYISDSICDIINHEIGRASCRERV